MHVSKWGLVEERPRQYYGHFREFNSPFRL